MYSPYIIALATSSPRRKVRLYGNDQWLMRENNRLRVVCQFRLYTLSPTILSHSLPTPRSPRPQHGRSTRRPAWTCNDFIYHIHCDLFIGTRVWPERVLHSSALIRSRRSSCSCRIRVDGRRADQCIVASWCRPLWPSLSEKIRLKSEKVAYSLIKISLNCDCVMKSFFPKFRQSLPHSNPDEIALQAQGPS